MKNNQLRSRQIIRKDRPSVNKVPVSQDAAKVIPFSGLDFFEARKTLAQIYDSGMLHFREGRFDEACLDFRQAGQGQYRLASCIQMASRCYRLGGQPEKAVSLLKIGVERKGWSEEDAAMLQQELAFLLPAVVTPAAAERVTVATEPAVKKDREQVVEKAPEPEAAPENSASPAVDLYAAPTSKLVTVPFGLLVVAVLVAGYLLRVERHLTAESGLGYQLGIIGSLLMLLLMLYPLRKKARFMRNWGPIPHWFRFHMLAVIIGPILILFHANFQLGSLNSQVVLGSTLLVAGSGLFGRYLYTRIHCGLYGKRVSLEQLHDAISNNHDNLAAVFVYAPRIQQRLLHFDAVVLRPSTGVFHSIGRVLLIDLLRRWTHLRIKLVLHRALKVSARRNHWSRRETSRQYRAANLLLKRHLSAVLKVAEFSFYERFFALWHVFHMPLFLLLVIALVMHVIAVHMY